MATGVFLNEPIEFFVIFVGGDGREPKWNIGYDSPFRSLEWVKRWRPWCLIFLKP